MTAGLRNVQATQLLVTAKACVPDSILLTYLQLSPVNNLKAMHAIGSVGATTTVLNRLLPSLVERPALANAPLVQQLPQTHPAQNAQADSRTDQVAIKVDDLE